MSVLYSFTSDVIETLMINGNSLPADLNQQNLWEDSNTAIGNAWLNDGDPNLNLQTAIDGIHNEQSAESFFDGLSNWPITDWCSNLIVALQSKVAAYADKDHLGAFNGMATQTGSLVQANQSSDTATGESEAKSAESTLQNASSAGQPVTNASDSVIGVWTSGSSTQGQITA